MSVAWLVAAGLLASPPLLGRIVQAGATRLHVLEQGTGPALVMQRNASIRVRADCELDRRVRAPGSRRQQLA